MIKSPFKYPKWPILLSTVFGSLLALYAIIEVSRIYGTISPLQIGAALAIILVFALKGWVVAYYILGTIFTRPVNHPMTIDKLEDGKTYFLNGETPATLLGLNSNRTKFVFHIAGYDSVHHLDQGTELTEAEIKTFISEKPEVFA